MIQNLLLGVDVGGTNTDAVVLDDRGRVRASAKTPTTPDVIGGIVQVIDMVLAAGLPSTAISAAMLGTTQCITAHGAGLCPWTGGAGRRVAADRH